MTAEEMRAGISAALERRAAECAARGNETQRKKWAAELKALTHSRQIEALVRMEFEPQRLENLAVYATMKLRRLAEGVSGAGKPDPYTATLVRNALAVTEDGVMTNGLMTASLTQGRKTAVALPTRRHGSEGTAATQACSTRAALEALGAGARIGRAFRINQDHPAIRAIVGAAAKEA